MRQWHVPHGDLHRGAPHAQDPVSGCAVVEAHLFVVHEAPVAGGQAGDPRGVARSPGGLHGSSRLASSKRLAMRNVLSLRPGEEPAHAQTLQERVHAEHRCTLRQTVDLPSKPPSAVVVAGVRLQLGELPNRELLVVPAGDHERVSGSPNHETVPFELVHGDAAPAALFGVSHKNRGARLGHGLLDREARAGDAVEVQLELLGREARGLAHTGRSHDRRSGLRLGGQFEVCGPGTLVADQQPHQHRDTQSRHNGMARVALPALASLRGVSHWFSSSKAVGVARSVRCHYVFLHASSVSRSKARVIAPNTCGPRRNCSSAPTAPALTW